MHRTSLHPPKNNDNNNNNNNNNNLAQNVRSAKVEKLWTKAKPFHKKNFTKVQKGGGEEIWQSEVKSHRYKGLRAEALKGAKWIGLT